MGAVCARPVGLAVDLQHGGAVQQPVEYGRGDHGVVGDLAPGGDAAAGGQHDRALHLALRDDLEQRGGAFGLQGSSPARR